MKRQNWWAASGGRFGRHHPPAHGEQLLKSMVRPGTPRRLFHVSKGSARSYLALEDDSEIMCLVSIFYTLGAERGIRWDDPAFNVRWPLTDTCSFPKRVGPEPTLHLNDVHRSTHAILIEEIVMKCNVTMKINIRIVQVIIVVIKKRRYQAVET